MNLFAEVKQDVDAALSALAVRGELPGGLDMGSVTVEPPRDAAHGDMATNAAMVLAKAAGHEAARPCRADRGRAAAERRDSTR